MKYCLFMAVFFTYSFSALADQEFRLFDKETDKYQSVAMIYFKGRLISANCKKASKISCNAIAPKKMQKIRKGAPLLGHPASSYCSQVGGKSRILFDAKNDPCDYCLFPDGSMTDSWQLYNESAPQ